MKKLYKSFNTILLLLTLLTFGVGNAWAWRGAKVTAIAQPGAGGSVYVGNSNSAGAYKSPSDNATQTDDWATGDKTFTFYLFAQANDGYVFSGWSESSSATSGDKSSPLTISILTKRWGEGYISGFPAERTRYAIFTPKTYSVTLNPNGGTPNTNQTVTATYAAPMPTKTTSNSNIAARSKTGYTFTGYWDAASNGNKYYNANLTSAKSWDKTAATTLYAHWSANTYKVSFNSHGGTAKSTATVTYDATYGAGTNWPADPTRTGYTFNGWFTAETGGTQVTSSTKVQITSDQTLHAQWTAKTYTVSFNSHGGTAKDNTTVTYDATYGASTNWPADPTRTGYTFNGWFTAETGGTQVTSSTTVKITAAQTLHAQWTAKTYTVSFNSHGGSSVANKTVTYDATYGTLTTPTRTGYKFAGWFTAETGGTQVTSSTKVQITAAQTLHAHWTAVTVNNVASNGAPTTAPLNFTKPESKTATVVFNVSNADGTSHFTTGISGAGWTITNTTYASNQVTVTAQYTCAATTAQGQHTATVTLTSKAEGGNSQTATVAANVNLAPTLTANPTTLAFGEYTLAKDTKKNKTVALTFNVNAITFEKTADANIAPFSAVLSNNNQTLTVYFEPTTVGSWEKDLVVTVKNSQSTQLSTQQTIHLTGSAIRHTATITNNIANSYKVDDAALNLNTLWTSTSDGAKTYSIVSFTPSGSNNEDATAPTITNNTSLSLGQAGTLVVKMQQPQTTNYNAVEVTKTITINKYTNALTCDWNSWSKNLATDDGTSVHISSNNDVTPITVTQTSGEANATYYPAQHAIYTAYNLGSATWTVAQAENYKYVAPASQTLTVNIITVTEGCYVYGPAYPDATASSVGEIIIPKAGAGNVLSFQMKKNGSLGDQATLTVFDANNTQLAQWKPEAESIWYYDDASNHTYTLPTGAAKVYFQRGGTLMDSDDPYINNIRITRTEWIKLQDVNGATVSSLGKLTNTIGGNSATATFYVDNSVCASEIKVASNNAHVTVNPASFTPSAERQQITVTYSSNTPEEIDATITVYTASKNATLTLTAETEKQTPYLTWGILYQAEPVSLPVTFLDSVAATASNEAVVTYSVLPGEESVISIGEGALSFTIVGEGTAHLTATSAESTMWKSVSETKEIRTTNKKIQNIVWNQNFTRGLKLNDERAMTAEVSVYDLAAKTEEVSAERTALIQYTCPAANGVIEKIDATHFRVIGYGETTITASVAGNEDFAAASSVSKIVRVREAQTGECDPALMYEAPDEIEFYAFSLGFPQVVHDVTLDLSKGKPNKLNFYVRGVSYDVAVQYFAGAIDVYESTDGGSTWSDKLATVAPEKNTTAYSETIQLSQNATHLRFVRPQGGQGYHYVGGITVTAVPELRVANAELDLGNIGCGATYNGQIQLSYFNVKGNLSVAKANSTNGLTIEDEIEADCGTSKIVNVPFSVYPTEEGAWSNKVTITDALNNMSVEVTLTAHVTKAPQSIVWDPETTVTTTTPPVLNAYATSGLPVTYEITSGSNVATISEGKVIISNNGQFTIKVSQAGNVSYQATELSRTFTMEGGYVFNGAVSSDWNNGGNWEIGSVPTADKDVIINGNVIINSDVEVNSLTIESGSNVTLTIDATLTVGDGNSFTRNSYGNLHVQNEGNVILNKGNLKVNNFILDAALGDDVHKAKSGQVKKSEKLNVNGVAYFQMEFDPAGAISYGWYDFTVPFTVNISGGIARLNNDGSINKVMVEGQDFLIMEDDEANFVKGGKGWKQFHSGVLQPGKLYTITFDDEVKQNSFRFTWDGNGNMINGASFEAEYHTSASDPTRNGWNAMGNGMLRHGYIASGYKMQAYNHMSNTYEVISGNKTFAVGSAFFIQVPAAEEISWTAAEATELRPLFAPKYVAEETDEFRLSLRKDDAVKEADVLYFSASEEATDAYVIGQDLIKKGTMSESKKARMWATKGGKQLCDVEATLVNGNATTPLFFFAPAAGLYELAIDEMPANADLYLTYNDQIIWDLTTSPYTMELTKGTTSGYGLRVVARTPQITTGVDNTSVDSKSARKVLINNTLYILTPEGEMYDAVGKFVK